MIDLLTITNDPELAARCDQLEGMRVFVDLEREGKAERQKGMDTFISTHQLNDVARVRAVLKKTRLMVRVNPFRMDAPELAVAEVNAVLAQGADLLMLPMFTSAGQLQAFAEVVNGRAPIVALLETAGLADTLRWRDDMPLGFFVELPDRALHARRKVALGSPEFHQRSVKTVVWWSLALMTGQFREGCVPFMDQASAFFRHFSSDPDTSALSDTDIEQSPPELDEILMAHVTPGQMRAAMQQMRVVEEQVSRVFERLPERWRRMLQVHGTAI